jgi:ABC-2 type transport system ATP-binding protein
MLNEAHNDIAAWDTVVRLDNVTKIFKQRQRAETIRKALKNLFTPKVKSVTALDGISLDIHRGEIVAYAGPNGAGKSTTVKLLSGMLSPNNGSVRALNMNPITERVRYVKHIGVVFGHRTELCWDQPISASFEWKKAVWDIPTPQYERMQALVIDLLGLKEFWNTLARELSLGQRMRADFGLMLLHEPDILFLDEPTLGLDVLTKKNILRFLKCVNAECRTTIMMTSHNMYDLEQLATRLILIDKGRIFFDSAFPAFREQFGNKRRLFVTTDGGHPPPLSGAEFVKEQGNQYEYEFDARHVNVVELLDRINASAKIVDIETHQLDIEDIFADVYETLNEWAV